MTWIEDCFSLFKRYRYIYELVDMNFLQYFNRGPLVLRESISFCTFQTIMDYFVSVSVSVSGSIRE